MRPSLDEPQAHLLCFVVQNPTSCRKAVDRFSKGIALRQASVLEYLGCRGEHAIDVWVVAYHTRHDSECRCRGDPVPASYGHDTTLDRIELEVPTFGGLELDGRQLVAVESPIGDDGMDRLLGV